MRDITSDAACGTVNRTWMRGCLRVTDIRHSANIHIDCTHNHTVILLGKDISFAFNQTLAHQIHNMSGNT
ncbi:hypothetical protein ExPUPEC79_01299 [Escherichia coli]|nr:hypothetical protein ExPUPEC79_01299 [Escherichia coli]CSE32983.1 Uncharacterised protein [Shigella sonnei]CSE46901.1 Uncharacterised protein [Shigella sonnei]CSE78274.1 Uncharacterised protein [Shigella sonnei]CSF48357.1 Uncharacterised protein [Shigella sonnei]